MYGEKQALKSRLEELNKAEERAMRHYQEERERIYERLRKLDEEERFFSQSPSKMTSEPEIETTTDSEDEIEENHNNKLLTDEQLKLLIKTVRENVESEHLSTIQTLTNQLTEAKDIISSLRQIQIPKNMIQSTKEEIPTETLHKEGNQKNQKESTTNNRANRKGSITRNKRTEQKKSDLKGTAMQDKIDYTPLYQEALELLKNHTASIQSSEIKKIIEGKTGMEIPNMTTFMERLMKKYPLIEKPYRGQYIYRQESLSTSENEEINSGLSASEARQQLQDQENIEQAELLKA